MESVHRIVDRGLLRRGSSLFFYSYTPLEMTDKASPRAKGFSKLVRIRIY